MFSTLLTNDRIKDEEILNDIKNQVDYIKYNRCNQPIVTESIPYHLNIKIYVIF